MSSSTNYTMQVGGVDVTPNVDNLLITLDGVIQHAASAYTVSGSTLTFDSAPGSGVEFYGVVMGQSSSFGEGSIGADELKVTGDGSSGQVLASDGDGTFTWTTDTENYLPLAGGTMSGAINLGSQNVTNGGTITGTFVGNITGNVTGNTSGTAATVTGAAQSAITSVGTLTSLAVGDATSQAMGFQIKGAGTTSNMSIVRDSGKIIEMGAGGSATYIGYQTSLEIGTIDAVNFGSYSKKFDINSSGNATFTGQCQASSFLTGDLILKSPTNNGHYTIWEEEEYLAIRNELTGKKYKFVLEEIE
jgi:hypothetical protein